MLNNKFIFAFDESFPIYSGIFNTVVNTFSNVNIFFFVSFFLKNDSIVFYVDLLSIATVPKSPNLL